MKGLGIGVSTSVGIGGDPVNGSSFKVILKYFEVNDETHAIVVIREIGVPQEAEAASYISTNIEKPVVAYVAWLTAQGGCTMGHAGAFISAFWESASKKVEILIAAGVIVAKNPTVIGETVARFI